MRTTAEFAEALLNEAHVAVTAGEGFDAPGFFRISYATSLDRLREGVTRIHEFVRRRERGGVAVRDLDPAGDLRPALIEQGRFVLEGRGRQASWTRRSSRSSVPSSAREHALTDAETLDRVRPRRAADRPSRRSRPAAGNTAEICRHRPLCNQHRVPLVVRGAGTGYTGGAVPVSGGVVVSMERLNRILEIDEENLLASSSRTSSRRAAGCGRSARAVLSARSGQPEAVVALAATSPNAPAGHAR